MIRFYPSIWNYNSGPTKLWLEREIFEAIQQCIGPKYVGPLGNLRVLTNGSKLIFTENILPFRGNIGLFSVGSPIAVIN